MLSRKLPRMTALAAELPRIFSRVPAEQLARACGKTLRSVNRWIEGHTQPSASDLMVAIQNFDVIASEVDALTGRRKVTEQQREQILRALELIRGPNDSTHTNP